MVVDGGKRRQREGCNKFISPNGGIGGPQSAPNYVSFKPMALILVAVTAVGGGDRGGGCVRLPKLLLLLLTGGRCVLNVNV